MQRLLITGANRGLGLEMVQQYMERGDVRLWATCRQPDQASALQRLAADHPDRLHILPMHVDDVDAIQAAALMVGEDTPALDVLVNNAGVNPPGRQQNLTSITPQMMQEVFNVNAVGPLMIAKAFLPLLQGGAHPRLVNISSQMGAMVWQRRGGYYAYTTSKAALNMVTRGLAADLGRQGITVVTVHPGWVQTDMGGPDADLTPEASGRGLLKLIDELTADQNGMFLKWNGEQHPW